MKRTAVYLIALGLVWLAGGAQANSLSFEYVGAAPIDANGNLAADVGDMLTFDVIFDFEDSTFGGGFDITWQADVFDFLSVSTQPVGDPALGRDPDYLGENQLTGWAIGDFPGLAGRETLGTLDLVYLGGIGDVVLSQASGGCDCWPDAQNPVVALDVDFGSVSVVPLPAAAWLLLSALGSLLGLSQATSSALTKREAGHT